MGKNAYSSESPTTRTATTSKFDESYLSWAATLIFGLFCIPMNLLGVWVARRNAWEVNGIGLTPWWYLYASLGPLLAVVLTIVVPSSSRFWKSSICTVFLMIVLLASLACMPIMYLEGGFD